MTDSISIPPLSSCPPSSGLNDIFRLEEASSTTPEIDMTAPIVFEWEQLFNDVPHGLSSGDDLHTPGSVSSMLPCLASTPDSDLSTFTPQSTATEQSQLLDIGEHTFDFELDLPSSAGIAHDPSDIIATLPEFSSALATEDLTMDPTMTSTFGFNFGESFGDFTNVISELGLSDLISGLSDPAPPSAANMSSSSLTDAYKTMGWTEGLTASEVMDVGSIFTPSLAPMSGAVKRKAEDSSDESITKRNRGSIPTSVVPAKRAYRRQSKGNMTVAQLAAAGATASPSTVLSAVSAESSADTTMGLNENPVRFTTSGKPSTARPKSVVPEKFMKDGQAQAITGMTPEQINSFPNWSALLAAVEESRREAVEQFGELINGNRDKAKIAAKKSRDERKAKVEHLEDQVKDLRTVIDNMRGMFNVLIDRGAVSRSEIEAFL